MKAVFFYHAFSSCWNNGNTHFLRGVTRELARLGHQVVVYEPEDGWSCVNAIRDGGEDMLRQNKFLVPQVSVQTYHPDTLDLDKALHSSDLVVVHEWNPPELISRIGRRCSGGGTFTLLFHDTHHRAITAADDMARIDLNGFDGVLAFGEVLRELYTARGWTQHAFTWHEAADIEIYKPLPEIEKQRDLVWIGNWGDDERSSELNEYLFRPVQQLGLSGCVYGVRYPQIALQGVHESGLSYGGWLPNHEVPREFAKSRVTIHVPRAPYTRRLLGIPTIRMFEALACGIPLISAPWFDDEHLFPAGSYISVHNGESMKATLSAVLSNSELASSLARTGLRTIHERHTCRHRAQELLAIVKRLRGTHTVPMPQQEWMAS